MKAIRTGIILTTLALAGFAGTSDGATLRGAACRLDTLTSALSGSPAPATCER